jgi:hypothetical protein
MLDRKREASSMKRLAAIVTVLVTAGFAGSLAAQTASVPKPNAAMGQLEFFVGSWKCTGQAEASPFGPAHPTAAKVKIFVDLGGFWLNGRYDEEKTASNPMPVHFAWMWHYDEKDKVFDGRGFGPFGDFVRQESKGWVGDKLVFDGETRSGVQTFGARDTFTRKGENELVHLGEMQADGKWAKLDEETCKRTPVAAKK